MKTNQKTPTSVTTGGHREQGLENLYTHRTAACTGETRSRIIDLKPGDENGHKAFMPPDHQEFGYLVHRHHQMKWPRPAVLRRQLGCAQFLAKPQFAHSQFLRHLAATRQAYRQYLADLA